MKTTIKNRHGLKVVVLVEIAEPQKGLAFVMHGLGGFKEQPHIQVLADELRHHGYTVVRFDATNSFGESDGKYEDATITNYKEDLEDVITWTSAEPWYQEPFILTGHSLGGICTSLYAERHPKKVLALAPMSSVISGEMMLDAEPKERVAQWNNTGWKITPSESKPGLMKKLNWRKFADDSLQYNLLNNVEKLRMPVLLIVGSEDHGTPASHQKILFDKLPGQKQLEIIKGMPHTPRDESHLGKYRNIFALWLNALTS